MNEMIIFNNPEFGNIRMVDEDGSVYLALFNLSDEKRVLSLSAEEAGLTGIAYARELWTGSVSMALTAELAPHDAAVWLVREA